jgi:hypothetical protein
MNPQLTSPQSIVKSVGGVRQLVWAISAAENAVKNAIIINILTFPFTSLIYLIIQDTGMSNFVAYKQSILQNLNKNEL